MRIQMLGMLLVMAWMQDNYGEVLVESGYYSEDDLK